MFHSTNVTILENRLQQVDTILQDTQNLIGDVCSRNLTSDFADISEHAGNLGSAVQGFAIKLSILQELDVSIAELLKVTTHKILIDAESFRLDRWLVDQLDRGVLSLSDLDRLLITIQVKRADAKDQLEELDKYSNYGLRVLLVAGHSSYLQNTDTVDDVVKQFGSYYHHQLVEMIGTGKRNVDRIKSEFVIDLSYDDLLELQGYQKFEGSLLWSYFGGKQLTKNAQAYLARRNSTDEKFVARSIQDLVNLASDHNLFLFLDGCCKFHYLTQLGLFDKSLS